MKERLAFVMHSLTLPVSFSPRLCCQHQVVLQQFPPIGAVVQLLQLSILRDHAALQIGCSGATKSHA
eukprot:1156053-Pelagomonas_calceolata.AAC.6